LAILTGLASTGQLSTSQLGSSHLARLSKLVNAKPGALNLEQEEIAYQEDVQDQTLADLAAVYSPEHADRLQVAYASFTPESSIKPGEDRGYGLHIVKRLDLPLSGGGTRTIYVNEQWVEDKLSKGLFLPDEIRIKTQAASGTRRAKGSEQLYVFDSIRIAWGPYNREPQLARRTVYTREKNSNEFKVTRSAVSAPLSCAACHQPASRLADAFLAPGEERNYEGIVQDSHFRLPPPEMRGYKQYVSYLESSGASPTTVQKAKETLSQPKAASAVPGILEAIKESLDGGITLWLAGDALLSDQDVEDWKSRQGVYRDYSGRWRVDALYDVIEGKYVWWEPIPVIP
jgi:hypothetical protein